MVFKFIYRVFCGFFLGVSVVAPGFSGSIIAITMGIYHDLLRIISNPFKKFKQNVKYCLPLAIGAAVSAVLFVLTFRFLFDAYPKAMYLLFIGLITGNIPVIFAQVKKCGFQKRYLIGGAIAFAAALILGILSESIQPAPGSEALSILWYVWVLGGIAGGVTALIPGMSVTMILMIIGVYSPALFAADRLLHLDFEYLIPSAIFGVSAVAGLVISSRGINYIFKKYPGFANSIVLGIMSGALAGILVRSIQIIDAGFTWQLGCIMLAAGLGVSIFFALIGKKMNKEESAGETSDT